ncbi:tetratricopeptide repeat protein [Lacipirellula parvula]|uniref:Lipoprotein NlpI n=1 Tax=Lacipirellula parvula TaxID=2650471 RepID=A0A5K7X7G9_9BACT|nr:tetratricopeptide repeat protein [Lacipirellula parvula]BBO30671.1 hypothetical protein PLANPX_0283 [Lacipirellula parvula]
MEFHNATRFNRVAGALLALGVVATGAGAYADESNISFVSDEGVELQEPAGEAAGASDLVVFADDSQPAVVVATPAPAAQPTPSAQGTLSVVANSGRQAPLAPVAAPAMTPEAAAASQTMLADAAVTPAAHRRGPVFNGQSNRRGGMNSPVRQQPQRQPSADDFVAITDQDEPARPSHAASSTPQATPQSAQTSEQLLVSSYQLSLTAQSEAEYSQIIRDCAASMRGNSNPENRKFSHELSAWALNRRGQARADQGQFDLALADFRAAIEFDANCWRAYHNRGVSLAQAGQFAEAFDDICRCIAINPNFAKAYSNRATLYVQAGDVDNAVSDYESALRLEPQLTQALVGYGRLCHMTGRFDDALANLDRAMAGTEITAEVCCSRGDLLVDLGRYTDALKDYAKAIDLDPQFEHAYRNGAWLLATCPDETIRDAKAALAGAQKALACGYGDRCAALDTLAAAQANAGQYREAVATINQAIQIAPPQAREAYEERRAMYQAGQPFRTEPVSDVQTADFVEG